MTKSGAYLAQRWLSSIGNGGIMNIGIAPNCDGQLSAEDVSALTRFGEIRKALLAQPAASGPANIVEMREDISQGERVNGWRLFSGEREIARGRSIGLRRIRTFTGGEITDIAALRVVAEGARGDLAPDIALRAFRADPSLLRSVLAAKAPSGDTDTAQWMQQ